MTNPRIPVSAAPAALLWWWTWNRVGNEVYRTEQFVQPDWVLHLREEFAARASRWGGEGYGPLPGLVIGDTHNVSPGLADAMATTSLTHLMAVSGANCAVVVGVAWGIAALCGAPLAVRIASSFILLALFVLMVGPEPSVIRAAIMATIALGAIASGRPATGLTTVSLAVIAALLVFPSLSRSVGFALSVAATVGLLVLGPPLQRIAEKWLPPRLAMLVALPVAASVACQPIVLGFAPYIPTYGIIANMLCDPVVPVATVAGLASIALASIPVLASAASFLAWLPAMWIALVSRTLASAPWATIPWPPGAVGIVLMAVISAGVATAILTRHQHAAILVVIVSMAAGLGLTTGATWVTWANAPREWSWAQCDVGQGDAVVLRSKGLVALVDTGRTAGPLRGCLAVLGITHIDLLVLTHFDRDHVGGYDAVVGRVTRVVHGPTDGVADAVIVERLHNAGAIVDQVSEGTTGSLGAMRWRVLWPPVNGAQEPGNPSSVTMEWRGDASCVECVSALTLGDLPAEQQRRLLTGFPLAPVDLVKVSHHGSRDQDSELYRRIHAPLALIGVGRDNDYGHPTQETLDMLRGVGSTAIRSDRRGIALVTRTQDGVLHLWSERRDDTAVN